MKHLLVVIGTIVATLSSPAYAVAADAVKGAQVAFAKQLGFNCVSGEGTDWIAEDAIYQYALNRVDIRLHVEGRKAIADYLCALSESAQTTKVANVHFYPTLNPEKVFVQYELVPVDGIGERRGAMAIIEMRDHRIAGLTQLSRSPGSLKVLEATTKRINQ
jgi:hypothetical protein